MMFLNPIQLPTSWLCRFQLFLVPKYFVCTGVVLGDGQPAFFFFTNKCSCHACAPAAIANNTVIIYMYIYIYICVITVIISIIQDLLMQQQQNASIYSNGLHLFPAEIICEAICENKSLQNLMSFHRRPHKIATSVTSSVRH